MEYYDKADLVDSLESLGFHLVGYGCTTCIGNSGPLPDESPASSTPRTSRWSRVLSGNRNFEGRINPDVKMNYLASPPLVVGVRAGGDDGHRPDRRPARAGRRAAPTSTSRTSGPPPRRSPASSRSPCTTEMFRASLRRRLRGRRALAGPRDPRGRPLRVGRALDLRPPAAVPRGRPEGAGDAGGHRGRARAGQARRLRHHRPHLARPARSRRARPAAQYLNEHGVEQRDFNSYGSRRGNHEVMVRGTFANIRLRNQLAPGTEGGFTRHMPDGEEMTIYDASIKYAEDEVAAGRARGQGVRLAAPRATGRPRARSCSACAR